MPTLAFPALGGRHLDLAAGFDDDAAQGQDRRERGADGGGRGRRLPQGGADPSATRPDEDAKINPYAIGLDPDRWEADGLFDGSGVSLAGTRERTQGLEHLWMEGIAQPA